jgi:hypothetical protein
MDNPEIQVTLGTKHRTKTSTTQKTILVAILKEHKTDLTLSMMSSFVSSITVYYRWPSEFSIFDSFPKQSINIMVFSFILQHYFLVKVPLSDHV